MYNKQTKNISYFSKLSNNVLTCLVIRIKTKSGKIVDDKVDLSCTSYPLYKALRSRHKMAENSSQFRL